tara:strand:+ start:213 stop:665 length:453 start_codon:yes stop_codon:yes gene_type:complete
VDIDTFVQEGSGIPSLFNTEKEAKRCAKDLWPKDRWVIKPESYIQEALPYDEHCVKGLCQPVPRLTVDGKWVCPVTGRFYKSLTKRIFTNILVEVRENPEKYMPTRSWRAFNYGSDWFCPYTGKAFKRAGKYLDDHLIKQRAQLARGHTP